jgi:hypothetical protein
MRVAAVSRGFILCSYRCTYVLQSGLNYLIELIQMLSSPPEELWLCMDAEAAPYIVAQCEILHQMTDGKDS